EEREREQGHEQPQREILAQVPPTGTRGSGRESVSHLRIQVCNERKVTIVLGVIESVPDQKRRRRPESHEAQLRRAHGRELLVEERADRQAPGPPPAQQPEKALQRPSAINYILYQQDMFALQLGFRVIEKPDQAARDLIGTIGSSDQEVDLHR